MSKYATEGYDRKYETMVRKPRGCVKRFVDLYLTKKDLVLDLGCGQGRHTKYIDDQKIKVIGVDLSSVGVKRTNEVLSKKRGSYAEVADLHELPFKNDTFTGLVCNRVLDYNDDVCLEANL